MSDQLRERFEVGERPAIELNLPSGDATFLPGDPGLIEVVVEGNHVDEFEVEQVDAKVVLRTPGRLRSRWDSFDVTIRMPQGTDVEIRAASADVEARVDLGIVAVEIASGDLRVTNVGRDMAVRSASGDVEIGSVAGDLAVSTASGDVRVRGVEGDAALSTASGDSWVGSALATLVVSTQSGDVEVERYEGEDLECNSASGDVKIGLPPGRALDVDINSVSGEIRSEFSTEPHGPPDPPPPDPANPPPEDPASSARLRIKTISGDISLVRTTDT